MDPHTQRAEAERWLGIAAKLLTARDFLGSRTFAMRAREADENNVISEQILAIVDTVLAGEKRVNSNQQPDWYSILQLPRLVRDAELIAHHYRRLVMCLNPERNRFPFADYALQLVMDAWSVLSDPTKKWLFDSQLTLYLQQQSHGGADVVVGVAQSQPQLQQHHLNNTSSTVGGGGGGGVDGGHQLNTFELFQPQSQPQSQPQQQMWQSQSQQQQINFMHLQSQPQSQQQQQQQILPQWQMRDPNVGGGGGGGEGERNMNILSGIGGVNRGVTATTTVSTVTPTIRPVPRVMPQAPMTSVPVSMARVSATMTAGSDGIDGNASGSGTRSTNINDSRIDNNDNNDGNLNGVDGGNTADGVNDENNDEGVVEEVDCFWTACPYCFYIFEYQNMYQGCTLRCQNCRRGFHAVQIPNPPPISTASKGGGGGKKDKEKVNEKGNSFSCWGFFPLGFSKTAWKKHKQTGELNGSSSWVPFTPMFTCPMEEGGGGFKWFDNAGGNAFVGPKHGLMKSTPRVYFDDDDDFIDVSEPSNLDSSDGDWRTLRQDKSKNKIRKRGKTTIGGRKRGRRRKNWVTSNVASGGGVSVGGEGMEDGSNPQEVVFGLVAGDKSNARKTVSAALARRLSRRSVKDVGRLDLNVEFNNDGEDQAPTVSAVNGEEDVIENIAFFDGLDEFLSTLPILNAGEDGKAKPS